MDVSGHVDPPFEPVRAAFAAVLDNQAGTGAAFAVCQEGRWVVDIWGGYADAARTRPWERDSIVQPYSVTKPFAAVCALRLVDQGRVDLDAPMQRYWPEFFAPATVRQVLSHQAGVVVLDAPIPTEVFYDWDRMCTLLAAQQPAWQPGTRIGESALFYGHLVGEVVRRVDGRSVGTYLREEVCGPLALDFRVGLDERQQARCVELTGLDAGFAERSAADRPALYAAAMANPPGALDRDVVNGSAWRAAEIPAVNGHGTARAVAGFYAALLEGGLLSESVLREATAGQAHGEDLVVGGETSWGLGFGVDSDGFGMAGIGGSIGAASRAGGYATAFLTGAMGSPERGTEVENTLRSCLGLPPLWE